MALVHAAGDALALEFANQLLQPEMDSDVFVAQWELLYFQLSPRGLRRASVAVVLNAGPGPRIQS